jgi:hypothetical protein
LFIRENDLHIADFIVSIVKTNGESSYALSFYYCISSKRRVSPGVCSG